MRRRNRTRTSRPAGIGCAVVVAVVLTACGGDDDAVDLSGQGSATPTPTPTTEPTPTPTPTPEPTPTADDDAAPAFDGGTEEVTLEGAPEQDIAVLSEVRVATHDGYDRVVFEFASGDRPRVTVRYEPEPAEPGSGQPVEVAGETALHVVAEAATDVGAGLYAPGEPAYDGPGRIDGRDTPVVTEVVALGDFEANMQWAIGTASERPFRVDTLTDPLRLVIDVGH